MDVTGKTLLFPIIGSPVSGVFSPPAFNDEFASRALDMAMVPLDIPVSALDAFWTLLRDSANMVGCSVTYPHKQAAFATMDDLTERAQRLGAVNTVRCEGGRLTGDATDGVAMCTAIINAGIRIAGCSAHVLGAGGGAGIAIVDELCANGVQRLTISEVNAERRNAVQHLVERHWPAVTLSHGEEGCDILINATTLGKTPDDDCPFSESQVAAASVVGDVVTHSYKTKLISLADAVQVPSVSGQDMGQEQIAAQLSFLLS